MNKTRVGIIGLGGISQVVHLPILNKFSNVEIAAVCDLSQNTLDFIAEKFNVPNKYKNYKELLKDDSIDAVIIATPTDTHHEIAIDAVNAGKNVLVEKPVSINSKLAKEMYVAAKKAGVKLMVGMNLRFRPDAMLLKSLINSGELGKVFYVKCGWLTKQSSSQKWFMQKQKSGGGVLTDLGILLVDLALWLVDFPKINTVSVQKYQHNFNSLEDSAVGLIRCGDETVINFDVSWNVTADEEAFGLSVFGDKGSAKLNPLRTFKTKDAAEIDYSQATSSTKNLFKKSYENELKHFIGAVRSKTNVISSAEEAVSRMELLETIYESADKNSEIKIIK